MRPRGLQRGCCRERGGAKAATFTNNPVESFLGPDYKNIRSKVDDLASALDEGFGLSDKDRTKINNLMQEIGRMNATGPGTKADFQLYKDLKQILQRKVPEFKVSAPKEEPRGLLTNLNVEKGPVKELPEAGRVAGEIRQTNSGVTGVRHPTDFDIDLRMVSVLKKQANQYGNLLPSDIAELKPILERAKKSNNAELVREVEGLLSTEVKTRSNMPDPAVEARKTAEAERLKKNVVSVDVPGAPKRGRAPETKPEMAYKPRVVPSDLKYKIGEEVLYGGRPRQGCPI